MNSLTTLFAMGVQTAKGIANTNPFAFRAVSVDSTPNFDLIENQNQMIGVHERATAQQTLPERSGISIPLSVDFGMYPRSIGVCLAGIGMVENTPLVQNPTGTAPKVGVTAHQWVKANQVDAAYLTTYIKMGESAGAFSRRVFDTRLSSMEWTLNRQGANATIAGLGLDERIVGATDYTTTPEYQSMIMPFLGRMSWLGVGGLPAYDFGCVREMTITWDRPVEEDDQCLHEYQRNDNQELSFSLSGATRGIDFSFGFYKHMIYGGAAAVKPSQTVLLTGLNFMWETGLPIPNSAPQQPFRLMMYIPKAEIRLTNFRASGNEVVRADMTWSMIDDQATPPVYVQLENDVEAPPAAPYSGYYLMDSVPAFTAASGNTPFSADNHATNSWDKQVWGTITPVADSIDVNPIANQVVATDFTVNLQSLDQFSDNFDGYSGTADITIGGGTGAVVAPTTATFVNGAASVVLQIDAAEPTITLIFTDDTDPTITGTSNAFSVTLTPVSLEPPGEFDDQQFDNTQFATGP